LHDTEVLHLVLKFPLGLFALLIIVWGLIKYVKDKKKLFFVSFFVSLIMPYVFRFNILPGFIYDAPMLITNVLNVYIIYSYRNEKVYKRKDTNMLRFIIWMYLLTSMIIPAIRIFIIHDYNIDFGAWGSQLVLTSFQWISFAWILLKIRIDKKFIDMFAKVLFIFGLIVALDGIFGYIFGFWKEVIVMVGDKNLNRISSFVGGGVDGALRVVVIGLISSVYLYFENNKKIYYFYLLLTSVFILYASERTGYIIYIVTILMIYKYQKFNLKYIFAVLLFVLVIILSFDNIFLLVEGMFRSNRPQEIFDANSMNQRYERWVAIYEVIVNHPFHFIFGFGVNNVIPYMSYYSLTNSQIILVSTLHNNYLDIIIEGGIMGLIYIILFYIMSIKSIIIVFFKRGMQYYFSVTFIIVVILMYQNTSTVRDQLMIFALVIIMNINQIKEVRK